MHQKAKDVCLSHLNHIIERVNRDDFESLHMVEERPMVPEIQKDGTTKVVRDEEKPWTLSLRFVVAED